MSNDEHTMDEELDDDEMSEILTPAEYKEEGNKHYKAKDYRSAIEMYTFAIDTAQTMTASDGGEISPETIASYYGNRAAASTMILRYNDALFDCDQALELDPKNAKALLRRAKLLTSLGRLTDAKIAFGRALIHDPVDDKLMKEMDIVKVLIRRWDLVQQLLADSEGTSGGDAASRRTMYPYLSMPSLLDSKQALNQINMLISGTSQEWKEVLLYKVQALVFTHQIQEAYSLTTSLMRRTYSDDASSSTQLNRTNSTLSTSSTNNNSTTNQSTLLLYRAHCLYCMGNIDEAVKHLRQILTTGDPDHKAAFKMHKLLKQLGRKKEEGDKAYKSGQFDLSVSLYTDALDLAPGSSSTRPSSTKEGDRGGGMYKAKLHFNRASAYANLRKHKEVIQDCTFALNIDPEYIKAYKRRASSYLLLGEDEGTGTTEEQNCQSAINDYETAYKKTSNEELENELENLIQKAKIQLKRSKQKDFYKMLNVSRDATEAEIKKSYKKAALKWHPDRHANSSEEEKKKSEKIFRDVNLAYEVLSDPEKKRKYDMGVDVEDLDNPHAGAGGGHGGMGGMGGIDPDMLFQMFMQQQGGGGMGGMHFG